MGATGYNPLQQMVPSGPSGPFGIPVVMKAFPEEGHAVLEELVLTDRLKVLLKARARYQAVGSLQFMPSASAVLVERREDGTTSEREIASMTMPEILGLPSTSLMWQNIVLYLETAHKLSVKEDKGKIRDACAAAGKAAMKFTATLMADVAMGVLNDEDMAEAKDSAVVLQVMET